MSHSEDHNPPPSFYRAMAKYCRCCTECNVARPCEGVCAGGMCDQRCLCDDDQDDIEEPEWDS